MPRARPRQRDEAKAFARAVRALRTKMGWTQEQLGLRTGVSRRTVTSWECGYWLPPHKQRVHLVLALREAPPEHVLNVADGLGVSSNPAASFMLAEFRAALDAGDEDPSAQPPARPRPAPDDVRARMDAVVREAADAMDVRPSDVRAALTKALAACAELGGTLEDAMAGVAVAVRSAAKGEKA